MQDISRGFCKQVYHASLSTSDRFLLRFGISPRTVLLVASDLVSMIGTMLSILLIRAAFGGLEPAIYSLVFPILLISPLLGAVLDFIRP